MREAAYNQELADEITEVKMTAFITEAAAAKPARSNTKVNGETVMSLWVAARRRLGSL